MHPLQRSGQSVVRYEFPLGIEDALASLRSHGPRARVIAGGTDLMLELARRERPGVDTLLDLSRVPGLAEIEATPKGVFRIGPSVTYSRVLGSESIVRRVLPLAQACLEVGSPEIRNCGTLAGGLVSAHPNGDLAPALVACGAQVELRSATGARTASVAELLATGGPASDELLTGILVPGLAAGERGLFVKSRARRGQAVAIANIAMVLRFTESGEVTRARIVCGAGASAPAELGAVEAALVGRPLDAPTLDAATECCARELLAGTRGTGDYARRILVVMLRRGLVALKDDRQRSLWPASPVTLARAPNDEAPAVLPSGPGTAPDEIEAHVNDRPVSAPASGCWTLLSWLRDSVGLTGPKEGCGEGVCGSCTVELDGKAVLACLVPAERARGSRIRTVEGLGGAAGPHPLQLAFIEQGAVQCGFCTPGFVMAGAALLAEHPTPGRAEIEEAFAGHLCRCTGYHAIRRAVEQAAGKPTAGSVDGDRQV